MAKIFITGSSDGLGLLSAKTLIANGHQVVLHARNKEKATLTREAAPGAKDVFIGDLASMEETNNSQIMQTSLVLLMLLSIMPVFITLPVMPGARMDYRLPLQ